MRSLVSIHKCPICLISALCSKFYPRNINHMHPKGTSFRAPAVKFFACLDLNPICLFLDGHSLSRFNPSQLSIKADHQVYGGHFTFKSILSKDAINQFQGINFPGALATLNFHLFPSRQCTHFFPDFHKLIRIYPMSGYGICIFINDVIWPQTFYCPSSNPCYMQRLIVL